MEEASKPLALPPSRRLKQIQVVESINVYGLFFGIGVAAANVSRLIPYGVAIYITLVISVIAITLLKAKVDIGRVILLGIGLSAIAFWDALIDWLMMPMFLKFWIIPLWQCLLYGLAGLMVLIGVVSVVKAND
jgi:hypothetical protein